jgi:porphobilinogen synthase
MPGVWQNRVREAVDEARRAFDAGVRAVLLFGLPEFKDAIGSSSWDPSGPVQKATEAIKRAVPQMSVLADVCLCEYTDHGHCGVIDGEDVDNDATLPLLAKQAVSYANAGADFVAPSDMMDGRVAAIRRALDDAHMTEIGIMAYSAKFASGFYGPFREAVGSAKQLGRGTKYTYQMDPANSDEALWEVGLDLQEGADMVMVKPGMPYLDIVRRVKDTFKAPTYVYQVSGEYAMLKAAAQNGWLEEERCMMEALLAFKRAGADGILTYFALDAARRLKASG